MRIWYVCFKASDLSVADVPLVESCCFFYQHNKKEK